MSIGTSCKITIENVFDKIDNFYQKMPENLLEYGFNYETVRICATCKRRDGRPRKNKTLIDDQRGIAIETGVKTKITNVRLNVHVYEDLPDCEALLDLCQECAARINIEQIAHLKQNLRVYRFKRKKELIDESFLAVSIFEEKEPEYYLPPPWLEKLSCIELELRMPGYHQFEAEYLNKAGASMKRI